MATIIVTTRDDTSDAFDGLTSLREAIVRAAGSAAADTIAFSSSLLTSGSARLALTQGELAITEAGGTLTIDGDVNNDGQPDIVIDAGGASRVMSIQGTAGVRAETTLDGLVITGGELSGGDGAKEGGGLRIAHGNVTIANVEVSGNSIRLNETSTGSDGWGGGVFISDSRLVATDLDLRENLISPSYGSGIGGGLYALRSEIRLDSSLVEGNRVGGYFGARGGGIAVDGGSLTIVDTTIAMNLSSGGGGYTGYSKGGGISAEDSELFLSRSLLEQNTATNSLHTGSSGGGIATFRTDVHLTDSRVAANSALIGAGIAASASNYDRTDAGTVTVVRSTIDSNFTKPARFGVAPGGGIYGNEVIVIDSTMSGNSAFAGEYNRARGGAIDAKNVVVINSSIVDNQVADPTLRGLDSIAASGGGISAEFLTVENSVIAGNRIRTDPRDEAYIFGSGIEGDLISNGHNIFSQSGITGALGSDIIINPNALFTDVLGPLGDNGGPTPTHGLLPGSPALNAGANADAVDANGDPLLTDQRGRPRVQGGSVDIGAVEGVAGPAPVPAAIAIDAGGLGLTAANGTEYLADQYADAGNTNTRIVPIAGTNDDALYQSERWWTGSFGYHVPLADGQYFVTLRFAELFQNAPGRVFDVALEGAVWLDNLDVYARVGKFRALDFTTSVNVVDGILDIDLIKQLKNPTINGIEIVPAGELVAAVNAGGNVYGALDGTNYAADFGAASGFTAGFGARRVVPIAGTFDDALYHDEHWSLNSFGWDRDLANGRYYVTLHFAETYYGSAGRRVFDVAVEGELRIDDLDLYATVGANRAYDVTLAVDVTDGHLDVDFLKQVGSPIIDAIKVVRAADPPPRDGPFAINVGGPSHTAIDGTVFEADDYFLGGNVNTVTETIAGTFDDTLYQSERWLPGTLGYEIPIVNGDYFVTLHFAELFHNGPGKTFDVALEGALRVDELDIFARVGKYAALQLVLPVSVADGVLDLDLLRSKRNPTLAAIEVAPVGEPVAAVNVGGNFYAASDGTSYAADSGFTASNVVTNNLAIAGTNDDALYQSERWSQGGFSWDLDVADGDYFLTLKLAETFHTSAGRRVFDVRVENDLLVDNLDIYAKAGFATAYEVTLAVTVEDGHLDLDLLPVLGAPKLNALVLVPVLDGIA